MMTTHFRYGIVLALLAACASDGAATAPEGAAPEAGAAGTAAAPTTVLQPMAAAPVVAATPAANGGSVPVATPMTAPMTAPTAPAVPTTPTPAPSTTPAAAEADTCVERRVSYSKPCHNDPDPCGLKSGWPGDEYCLLPPKPGEGIQIHFGPSDYKSMAEIQKYMIHSGEEFDNSVAADIPLTEQKWFQRMRVQMRPGSHHWISTVVDGKIEAKFYDDTGCDGATSVGSLGGGQNLIYDNPPGGVPAPENAGLGRSVSGNSSLCMNLHSYNFTDRDQMREIWINIYFIEEAQVTQKAQSIGMVGGLGLQLAPHQKKDSTYSGRFMADGRIIQLFGHRHAWTPRFAVWLRDELIYESWSWQDSVTFNYDSLSMNPPINSAGKVDGAVNGIVSFKAGDELKFTCFIENDSDKTLGFSNQVYDGEMCNLWGSAVGAGLSGNFR